MCMFRPTAEEENSGNAGNCRRKLKDTVSKLLTERERAGGNKSDAGIRDVLCAARTGASGNGGTSGRCSRSFLLPVVRACVAAGVFVAVRRGKEGEFGQAEFRRGGSFVVKAAITLTLRGAIDEQAAAFVEGGGKEQKRSTGGLYHDNLVRKHAVAGSLADLIEGMEWPGVKHREECRAHLVALGLTTKRLLHRRGGAAYQFSAADAVAAWAGQGSTIGAPIR